MLAPCPWLHAPLLVLDLGLDVVDGVRRLHLEGDRLTRKGLDEDLHRDRRRGVVVVDVHMCELDPGLVVVQTHVPQNGAYAETRVCDFLSPSTSTKRLLFCLLSVSLLFCIGRGQYWSSYSYDDISSYNSAHSDTFT
jgi:hypothetical protein